MKVLTSMTKKKKQKKKKNKKKTKKKKRELKSYNNEHFPFKVDHFSDET